MLATFLSDEVISSTELRANQKHWLEKAAEKAITIVNGRKQFALLNREHIRELYAQIYHTGLALNLCQEIIKKSKSMTFPWLQYLGDKEKKEFYDEYLEAIGMAMETHEWEAVEQLVEEWKATALIMKDPALVKELTKETNSSEYVRLKD
jgi:hypothetical protein